MDTPSLPSAVPDLPAAPLWALSVPWWEFVFRAVVIYVFLLVLFRITGKRQVGQLSAFDLILILILSNAVQNAMNAGDNSITGGLILALTLVALNYGVSWLSFRSRWVEKWLEGHAAVLVRHGKLREKTLAREQVSHDELMLALREAGCHTIHEVDLAVLEVNGEITVIERKEKTARLKPNEETDAAE